MSLLSYLGLDTLFGPSSQPNSVANPSGMSPEADPGPGPAVAKSGTPPADPTRTALNNTMMQLLMASLMAQPAAPPNPPAGGPTPPRPSGQAFQYSPTTAMAVGPRKGL